MTTIFEKIMAGEIPCHKIWEDNDFICFLDINPKSKGHALVVSKPVYDKITDMPDEHLQKMIVKVKETVKLLTTKLNAEGCNVVQNNGEVSGQEIPHFHIHIIPRYKGDGVSWFRSEYQEEDFEKLLEELK